MQGGTTIKADIMKGYPYYRNTFASNVYDDAKPSHCLSMLLESENQLNGPNKLYNVNTNEFGSMKFL